jgi:benzoylsuccinyl-CoA thiolase BbsB subunit
MRIHNLDTNPMKIAVLGVGQTPFTARMEGDPMDEAGTALRRALQDAGVSPRDVELAIGASVYEGPFQGQRILMRLGMNGIPIVNLENACSTGSTGIVEAARWIQAGEAELAVVVGVERLASKFATGPIPLDESLKTGSGGVASDPFVSQGMTFPSYYGLIAERHMAEHGSTREDWAVIAVKNREYATHNPNARFRSAPSLREVLEAPIISSPLGKWDCSGNADGAAAVVLASERAARRYSRKPVWLRAVAMASGELGDRLEHNPMVETAERAYTLAAVGPDDVDVVEVHDNFSPAELECYEELGFCKRGEGHLYLRAGYSRIGGSGAAFNPSGGLIGRGHAPGATGIVQFNSIVQQLRDAAGPLQHEGARVGMTHTSGGGVMALAANVCVITIMSN